MKPQIIFQSRVANLGSLALLLFFALLTSCDHSGFGSYSTPVEDQSGIGNNPTPPPNLNLPPLPGGATGTSLPNIMTVQVGNCGANLA